MDLDDRLAAEGCGLTAIEFRRVVLDTFGECYEEEEMEEILTDPAAGSVFCTFAAEESGRDDLPDDLVIETLGRLLTGSPEQLTPTELTEVGLFYDRLSKENISQLKRFVKAYKEIHGDAFLSQLPEGITVDADGEVHVAGEGSSPFDTRIN